MSDKPLSAERTDYSRSTLNDDECSADPWDQFTRWFEEARDGSIPEPNAMTLATVGDNGRPSARIVLIKEYDSRGIVWYTNAESRKGRELAQNPQAALLFHWVAHQRQVRIEGTIERVSDEMADEYFASRPLASRIGAWASDQSAIIANRSVLDRRVDEFAARFGESPPRPPHWGGYRLIPDCFEFWQGRPSRLHDRIRFRLVGEKGWNRERLAP